MYNDGGLTKAHKTKPIYRLTMTKSTHQVFLFNLLLLSSWFFTVNSFAATISVFTDRNPVRVNESFHLIFEGDDTIDGEPDFNPLYKDFDILNQNQSSQVSIINGQHSSTKKWTLTLMAKRVGKLIIPSIYFGSAHTTPSFITVQKAQPSKSGTTGANLFVEVEAEPKNPYVQSQVIYTVRFFYTASLKNASLTEPKLSGSEGIIEKLGEDASYKTQRDGRQFIVMERKYAIFPQQSGETTIEPLILDAKIAEGGRRSRFDDFGFFGQSRTRTKRLRSQAIALKVRPIPSSFKGQHWLPAKQLQLQENWSENPPQFKVGEPVTRTLTLLASGLTAGQLPDFSTNRSLGDNLKQYPDQAKLDEQGVSDGLISRREEKVAIIPSKAGDYTIPPIEIPWFNTETEQLEVASLPARAIKVLPADNVPQSPPSVVVPAEAPTPTTPIIQQPSNNYWTWLSLIFAIGWVITLIILWLTIRQPTKSNVTNQPERLTDKVALKNLKRACHSNDSKQAKDTLLAWGKAHWQKHPPNSLGEIGNRCGEPLLTEIRRLSQFLYSHIADKSWRGIELWKAFKAYNTQAGNAEKTIVDGLEPLYR